MKALLTGTAPRRLCSVVSDRLAEEPVIVLNGPRTVGKSTLLAHLAAMLGRAVIDCDNPAVRRAVRDDPTSFVRGNAPILIDEYQHVPELLDAIKAELNRDLSPGRYILAGSTRYSTLPQAGQSLTGRVDILPVLPLSQGEITGGRETFVHDLLGGGVPDSQLESSNTTRADYVERAIAGGMPVALRRPEGRPRSRWFANYIGLVLERDVVELSKIRQRETLPRLLTRLAAQSAQMLEIATAARDVEMEKTTAENYIQLLEAVFLVQRLPAWGTTLGSRVTRRPKLHMVDAGVMAWMLGLTTEKILGNQPSALTEYGHLLETFAVGEILKQTSWWEGPVRVGHFRTRDGEEVDLVLEKHDGSVIAFEIKAGSQVHGEDFKGIRALREKLGSRLERAFVLYTGPHTYRSEEGAMVVPLDRLWS